MARIRLTDYPRNRSFRNIVGKLNEPEAKRFLPKNAIALPPAYRGSKSPEDLENTSGRIARGFLQEL